MKILLTGASGLLGKHLKIKADRPTHKALDITMPFLHKPYDLIIHAAAYTDVAKAETDRWNCFRTNVMGTFNMLEAYKKTPFVLISTEYAKSPVNFYGLTKSLAELLVMSHPYYLIIRTLFKPNPWPFDRAFEDQFTNGDYVDVIAPLIEQAIEKWDKKTSEMIYIGTGRKTMLELAKRTRQIVIPNSIHEMSVKLPHDYE